MSEAIKRISFKSKTGARNRQFFSIAKAEGSTELEVSLLGEKQRVEIPTERIRSLITETINERIFGQFFPDAFISSTERTGAAVSRTELIFARGHLLEEMSRADDDINPRELLLRSYRDYSLPVKFNMNFMHWLESTTKNGQFSRGKVSRCTNAIRRNRRRIIPRDSQRRAVFYTKRTQRSDSA